MAPKSQQFLCETQVSHIQAPFIYDLADLRLERNGWFPKLFRNLNTSNSVLNLSWFVFFVSKIEYDLYCYIPGYSGADMTNLCREAALGPIRSIPLDQIETITSDQVNGNVLITCFYFLPGLNLGYTGWFFLRPNFDPQWNLFKLRSSLLCSVV